MMHKTKYLVTIAAFIGGLGLVTLGATSHSEVRIAGETLPIYVLARAFGLIAIFGSLITALVLSGSSLPPTRPEIEGRVRSSPRDSTGTIHGADTKKEQDKIIEAEPRTVRSPVHLARVSTEAKLRAATANKQSGKRPVKEKRTPNAV